MAKKLKQVFITFLLFQFCILGTIQAQNFEINVLKQTNLNRNKNLDGFFTTTSDVMPYVGSGLPFAHYIYGITTKDKKAQQIAIGGIINVGINGLSTYIIKQAVNRDRPAVTYPFLTPLEPRIKYSFPSGHTSNAFNTAMYYSLKYKKWYYVVPAFTMAGITAYSRMHIGVHYPTDVVGGATVGIISAFISDRVNNYLQHNKKTKPIYNKMLW
jgi:membrane-associated phospholipid phosphatase